MPNDNNINLKKLPQASEVNYGDFLLLETSQGTSVLDFKDFIITEYNTTFYPLISANSEDIKQIYSKLESYNEDVKNIKRFEDYFKKEEKEQERINKCIDFINNFEDDEEDDDTLIYNGLYDDTSFIEKNNGSNTSAI